ncbi:hypothetical protein KM043_005038 [Ampulex compressa]|nr:hypothetical protein KM043_005038 [Ampulex compressa]
MVYESAMIEKEKLDDEGAMVERLSVIDEATVEKLRFVDEANVGGLILANADAMDEKLKLDHEGGMVERSRLLEKPGSIDETIIEKLGWSHEEAALRNA